MAGLAGCANEAPIEVYEVKKEHLLSDANLHAYEAELRGTPHRLWGAIVLSPPKAWFFKVSGPNDLVMARTEALNAFLKSIHFEGGEPKWSLPTNWKPGPQRPDRFATLLVSGPGPTLDLSITQLSMDGWEAQPYLLQNVNRWRGQLGLPAVTAADLPRVTRNFDLPENMVAVLVEGEGRLGQGGPPFAGTMPPDHPPVGSPPPAASPTANAGAASANAGAGITYQTPAGWTPAPPNAFARLAFRTGTGADEANVTISALPTSAANAGDLLANVNRWRGQMQLGPTTAAEAEKNARTLQVGEDKVALVELASPPEAQPQEAMVGAMFVHGDLAWFVKLRGSPAAVSGQKAKFEEFVKSLKVQDDPVDP